MSNSALTFWNGLHSAYGMCISAFTLLWLTLEFFPAWSQGPSLSSPSQELAQDLGHDHPLTPHLACNLFTKDINKSTSYLSKKIVSNSMAFSMFAGLYNQHHSPFWNISINPKRNPDLRQSQSWLNTICVTLGKLFNLQYFEPLTAECE